MPPEYMLAVVGLVIYTFAVWILGWHFRAEALRDRNRRFLKEMKELNKRHAEGSDWKLGFQAGMATTLAAFEAFVKKFEEPKDGPS